MRTKNGCKPIQAEFASVRIAADLVKKLRVIAAHESTTAADVLDPVIRPVVERRYQAVAKQMHANLEK